MNDSSFLSPTRIVIGPNAVQKVPELIREQGGTSVLLLYGGGHFKKNGVVDTVADMLRENQFAVTELGGVLPNPQLEIVYEGIRVAKENHVDFILPLGGGSVIDAAKAIAYGICYDGDVWDFFTDDKAAMAVPKKCAPIGVILTNAATGSEASTTSVITRGDLKRTCDTDMARPRFAVENPEFSMSLPAFQTACGVVDIMSHSMERYFTPQKETMELTDRLCEAIFHTCMSCGRILKDDPQNYEARASIMLASTLSHNGLTGIGRTADWGSHMIEHELSGEYNVTHGAGLAVIIPAWMKYVYKDCRTLFLKWATRVMGVPMDFENPDRTILEGIQALEHFYQDLGLPIRLHELGIGEVSEETMYKMAKRVRSRREDHTIGNVKQLNAEDIVQIFKLAQ